MKRAIVDGDRDIGHARDVGLMLDRKGPGVARAADGRGHICRQYKVRVVAGNGDASTGGGVVDKCGIRSVGIGNGERDG